MPPKILNGKETAKQIRIELKKIIPSLSYTPTLAVLLVGEDPASAVYVRGKERDCQKVGIRATTIRLPADTDDTTLADRIDALNADPEVDGILLQLPIPAHLDAASHLQRIRAEKDVDGFHICNLGRLFRGDLSGLIPCTPHGIMVLLERTGVPTRGKHAVILGRSNIVGRPMAALLMAADATVTVCHSRTEDLEQHVRKADLLIAAMGVRGVVDPGWVAPGAIVVDVGMHRLEDGSLTGDLDLEPMIDRLAAYTPVPGGVGPMTRALLLHNTLLAAKARREQEA